MQVVKPRQSFTTPLIPPRNVPAGFQYVETAIEPLLTDDDFSTPLLNDFTSDKAFMYVISRKVQQTISIEGLGNIHVIQIKGNRVKLGFEFPRDISVVRENIIGRSEADSNNGDSVAVALETIEPDLDQMEASQDETHGGGMLVLSRKQGESILIDKAITVTVLGIRRRQVKLGIIAPQTITIKRV